MSIRVLVTIICQVFIITDFSESNEGRISSPNIPKDHTPVVEREQSKRIFQVLNQPKQFPPKRPNPQPRVSPILDFPELQKKEPLLDFPEYIDTDPILDFPDPIESYNNHSQKCKIQSIKQGTESKSSKLHFQKRRAVDLQNRKLLQYFVSNAIQAASNLTGHEQNGIKILEKTVDIFKNLCPGKYFPAHFIDNALQLFKKLFYLTSPGRTDFLSQNDFDWILRILDNCQGQLRQPIRFFLDVCSEEVKY